MTERLRIGLVGPDQTQPCGIADYTARLALSLGTKCDLVFVPFRNALNHSALANCQAILVQYERSLVPDSDFLLRMSEAFPKRIFVVPHEVYSEDPFAYPYALVKSSFPLLHFLKRLRYRWRHRQYAREKYLQQKAYWAQGVFPLSGPGAEILQPLAGPKLLPTIPLAFFLPPENASGKIHLSREGFFPQGVTTILGLFGFLNPGVDYAQVMDLLAKMDPRVCLLIIGGSREGGQEISSPESDASKRGLAGRVRVTGYLPESELASHLQLCDLFLCPMRFKSNSSSLLNLIHLRKPILVSDLPLSQFLKAQGAPLELFSSSEELISKVSGVLAGTLQPLPNRYPWSFDKVAEAYIQALQLAVKS
jgi:glycosyltransferase involved in cell wall biosynthesis